MMALPWVLKRFCGLINKPHDYPQQSLLNEKLVAEDPVLKWQDLNEQFGEHVLEGAVKAAEPARV